MLHDWPYGGLVLAGALLAYLVSERRGVRDPMFVLPLLWPMYLVHQFEEHGIDALGDHYAFLGSLCATLHYPDVGTCPADPAFIFAVNGVGCQLAFLWSWVFRRRAPLVAACAWGVPLVNAVTHIAGALAKQAYNPGLVTSIVLFLPLSLYMLRTTLAAGVVARRDVPRVIATGVATHVVLLASIFAYARGLLPYALYLAVNGANGLWPLVLGWRRAPTLPAAA